MIARLVRGIARHTARGMIRPVWDRARIVRLEWLMGIRRFHPEYICALVTQLMAVCNLITAARRRKWTPHIAGLLLLFVSALYFHEDFTRRRLEEDW